MTASSLPTRVPSAERLGAVTRELVREALAALGDQMSLTLVRTSHSDTVKSAMDFSSALCDTRGRLIAQGLTLPNQLGSIPDAAASVLRNFEDDLDPGDMIVMNDPFDGGMHLPDIFLFKPVFKDGAMIGYAKLGPPHLPFTPTSAAAELHQLYVLAAWHGAGVAAALIEWVITSARARGADELFLSVFTDNHRARRFYERHGFEPVGTYAFMVGTHVDEDIVMKLKL